jgi:glycosyltransferase involved in cell wall biosynthesis
MTKPRFSIIIPILNRRATLPRAVDSVRNQTFENWELILVDDYSTDGTREWLATLKEDKIKVLYNEANLERCASRNRGIAEAQGEYICFLDSDDYHLPEHLEILDKAITKLNNPEAFFFTAAWDETEAGHRTPRCCPDKPKGMSWFGYFMHYTVNPQRWAIHNNIVAEHTFDPQITVCEDMDLSLRLVAASVPVFQLPERTTVYVAAFDSFTHGAKDKWEREWVNLKKIFSRKVLAGKLPFWEKNRLLSMVHFHLTRKAFSENRKGKVWKHGLQSLVLFPPGYNHKTLLPLGVMLGYSVPFLGELLKKIVRRNHSC